MIIKIVTCFPPFADNFKGPTSLLRFFLKAFKVLGCDIIFLYTPLPLYLDNPTHFQEVSDVLLSLGLKPLLSAPVSKGFHHRSRLTRGLFPFISGVHQSPVYSNVHSPELIQADFCFCYPFWFAHLISGVALFRSKSYCIVGMDSAVLLHSRRLLVLLRQFSFDVFAQLIRFIAHLFYEYIFICFHSRNLIVVGSSDAAVFAALGHRSVRILVHPFFEDSTLSSSHLILKSSSFDTRRDSLNMYIYKPGQPFYGSNLYVSWIKEIVYFSRRFSLKIVLTIHRPSDLIFAFISRLTSGSLVSAVRVDKVPSYEQLLASQDVSLFPLEIGSGTKNSVMQAIASGTIVFGTDVALENIFYDSLVFRCRSRSSIRKALLTVFESYYKSKSVSWAFTECHNSRFQGLREIHGFDTFCKQLGNFVSSSVSDDS